MRRTLAGVAAREGVGVHSGLPCRLELRPAAWGHGLVFHTPAGEVSAALAWARAEPGATVLRCGPAAVSTPEHLLAALHALGVTDAELHLDGPEPPALDGSASGWVEAIDEAGRTDGPPLEPWAPSEAVVADAGGGRAWLGPSAAPSIRVEVDFGAGGPHGKLAVPLTEAAFRAEVAWARTFVRAEDVKRLVAEGRGKGATPENTVVWPHGPLRAPDEPVRHKLLDAWGDLALLGPSRCALRVVRGSHALHLAVLRKATAT